MLFNAREAKHRAYCSRRQITCDTSHTAREEKITNSYKKSFIYVNHSYKQSFFKRNKTLVKHPNENRISIYDGSNLNFQSKEIEKKQTIK